MKKKIGEIYNKPIVIGNKNEVSKHEVHIEELGVGGEGDPVQDNLSKAERAFIFDYDKYADYLSSIDLEGFNSCIVAVNIDAAYNKFTPVEQILRTHWILGFTVSSITCINDPKFNALIPYVIEVPVDEFYGYSDNQRVYFARRSDNKASQREYAKTLINKIYPNLQEGEEVPIKGYVIPLPGVADDFGCITHVMKEGNTYKVRALYNGQPTGLEDLEIW
jgi:hypothetical protein